LWSACELPGSANAGFSYRNWTLGDGAISEAGDAVKSSSILIDRRR
jgi:hypothetical protein